MGDGGGGAEAGGGAAPPATEGLEAPEEFLHEHPTGAVQADAASGGEGGAHAADARESGEAGGADAREPGSSAAGAGSAPAAAAADALGGAGADAPEAVGPAGAERRLEGGIPGAAGAEGVGGAAAPAPPTDPAERQDADPAAADAQSAGLRVRLAPQAPRAGRPAGPGAGGEGAAAAPDPWLLFNDAAVSPSSAAEARALYDGRVAPCLLYYTQARCCPCLCHRLLRGQACAAAAVHWSWRSVRRATRSAAVTVAAWQRRSV